MRNLYEVAPGAAPGAGDRRCLVSQQGMPAARQCRAAQLCMVLLACAFTRPAACASRPLVQLGTCATRVHWEVCAAGTPKTAPQRGCGRLAESFRSRILVEADSSIAQAGDRLCQLAAGGTSPLASCSVVGTSTWPQAQHQNHLICGAHHYRMTGLTTYTLNAYSIPCRCSGVVAHHLLVPSQPFPASAAAEVLIVALRP